MSEGEDYQFKSIVFAGGGNRCIWQHGFWAATGEKVFPKLEVVAGVSAGSCMAAMALGGVSEESRRFMQDLVSRNQRNYYPSNIFSSRPVFPHFSIYSKGLSTCLDQKALDAIKAGPELRILVARPPAGLPPLVATFLGFVCYAWEKHTKAPLHPQLPTKAGFTPEILSVKDCRSPEELVQWILASSATPPLIPPVRINGGRVLDGGLIDNVPVAALKDEDAPSLVILSRRYKPEKLKGHKERVYIQPSRDVDIGKFDYTRVDLMQKTFEHGLADGELFLRHGPEALMN